jgi:uncharacterized protein YjbJ (UPF0337 family)
MFPKCQTAVNVLYGFCWNLSRAKDRKMNWDQIEGKWKQFTGSARERWGKLTDNDWETIAGKRDQLVGRIQVRYGIAKEEAEKQADEWSLALTESKRERHGAATRI